MTSGISGHTTVDAGCAVTIDSTPCGEVPLPARISITDAAGTTVRETISNDQGEFRVELPSGTYELHAVNLTGAPLPSAVPEHVVVETGTFTEIRMEFDSGVR
ncbi:MAG: carboxypeptidase-like regulatory domain-containing protein [Specibacter sp.]